MVSKTFTPHILLQDFVQCIMVIHAESDIHSPPNVCPYPPTPQNSLFFYINDRISVKQEGSDDFILQPRSVIVGPQLTSVSLDINKSHKAVRVGFHPGGLYRLLGESLSKMVDDSFDAEDVFGQEIKEVNDRLQETGDFDSIRDIIENFLLKKVNTLKKGLPFDEAVRVMVKRNGNVTMEEIASMACLSLRQFERVSRDRIGFSPKLFGRLSRFSKAYRIRESFPGTSWTRIAYECGYFDQMHLIRDFKVFTGALPGDMDKKLEQVPVRMQAPLNL